MDVHPIIRCDRFSGIPSKFFILPFTSTVRNFIQIFYYLSVLSDLKLYVRFDRHRPFSSEWSSHQAIVAQVIYTAIM